VQGGAQRGEWSRGIVMQGIGRGSAGCNSRGARAQAVSRVSRRVAQCRGRSRGHDGGGALLRGSSLWCALRRGATQGLRGIGVRGGGLGWRCRRGTRGVACL
jgi:hypothetical protein